MTQTVSLCPQCGDECLPDAVLCDGCWHELRPVRAGPRLAADWDQLQAAAAIYHALRGLPWLTCRRLAARGFRAV
jgi:hypothetical protein